MLRQSWSSPCPGEEFQGAVWSISSSFCCLVLSYGAIFNLPLHLAISLENQMYIEINEYNPAYCYQQQGLLPLFISNTWICWDCINLRNTFKIYLTVSFDITFSLSPSPAIKVYLSIEAFYSHLSWLHELFEEVQPLNRT